MWYVSYRAVKKKEIEMNTFTERLKLMEFIVSQSTPKEMVKEKKFFRPKGTDIIHKFHLQEGRKD